MKILVLSDSHSALSFMRRCVEAVRPAAIIHLGDYFCDGTVIARENPCVSFFQVPGNCDGYYRPPGQAEVLVERVLGVKLYMTHGHKHDVKRSTLRLLQDARASRADAVLYGHTHQADCRQEEDGLWVLNPGSCGYFGGSAGVLDVENGKIRNCRILRQEDLEEVK